MLKVRTLFSGIGSPESALKKLEIPYELVDFCEVDKYAVKSYCAIHGVSEDKNLGDITKVWGRNLPYADLLVWGFPCQSISVAGKQEGIIEGETRSGLYYEGFRILKETKPKYSIIENVKNLVGKKFRKDFEQMLGDIESLGYNNHWKILNAKDYGIPQNRERVFIVSIRKDIDTGTFSFPKGFDNGLRLKDFLESEVEEKYYIKSDKVSKLLSQLDYENKDKICCDMTINQPKFKDIGNCIKARYDAGIVNQRSEGIGVVVPCITPDRVEKRQNGRRFKEDGDHMFTLTGQDRHGIEVVGTLKGCGMPWDKRHELTCRVYNPNGISPTVTAGGGGGVEPKILINNIKVEENIYKDNEQAGRVYNANYIAPSLNSSIKNNGQPKIIMYDIPQTVTVRKYPVDIEGLREILKTHKEVVKLTNKKIAEILNKPITLVEHWFRQDKCFSIPDADIWFRLKELLKITTDEFDKSITEFIEQNGVFEKFNRVYDAEGIAPTLTVASADEKVLEPNSLKFVGGIGDKDWVGNGKDFSRNFPQGNRVYDSEGIACSQTAQGGGIGSYTGLYLEPQTPMPELVGGIGEVNYGKQYRQGNRVYSSEKTAMCLMAQPVGNTGGYSYLYNVDYRIRKLTPKECWRLMGFKDEDF